MAGPLRPRPHRTGSDGPDHFFVVEADRSQLTELATRLRDGRLTPNIGAIRPLSEAVAAFGPDAPRVPGKTIIRVTNHD